MRNDEAGCDGEQDYYILTGMQIKSKRIAMLVVIISRKLKIPKKSNT